MSCFLAMFSLPSIIAGIKLKLIRVLFKFVQRWKMKGNCTMTRQGGHFQSVKNDKLVSKELLFAESTELFL